MAAGTAADPPGERRDRGAGQQHAADQEQQHGEDPRADAADEVLEPGFGPVADLAALPAEEEDEDEIDAEGDQEEADQVEVALLEARRAGAGRPRFRFGFRLFLRLSLYGQGARFLRTNIAPGFDAGPTPLRAWPEGRAGAKFAAKSERERRFSGLTSFHAQRCRPERRPRPRGRGRRRHRRRPAPLAAQRGLRGPHLADGVEALDVAAGFVPDLVVLDLGLPRLDGVEVCRRLRSERRRADPDADRARRDRGPRRPGLDSGADDYLVKPFERQELLARIRALLRRRPPRGTASLDGRRPRSSTPTPARCAAASARSS